ncbi:MAG: ABC transporter permease, partial [Rubrivivax sp.]|nr:ABC transporter permease [Rubrivivax sp.]
IAVLRRFALSLLTLLALAVFIFLATEVMPGDALDVILSSDEVANMPPERLAQMKRDLGLDRPAPERLAGFLAGAVQGDFGRTLISKAPVSQIVAYPMRNSVALALLVLTFALPLALAVGIASAYWHRRWADHLISAGAIVGYSIPEFVIGTVLVILFAVLLPWFPATITVDTRGPVTELLKVAALPVATIVIGSVAYLGRVLRVGMIEALNADSVERLRLTGVPEWRIVFRHALPAAVIPCLTAMALYAAALVSGIVVVELVFSIPGLGQELVRGVVRREVHVVQAIALASALIVVTLNLLADLAILVLDPRTRST